MSPGTDVFDALADAHRRAILQLLAEQPGPVGELADRLPISRPAVSRHLELLEQAGLVAGEADGTKRLYRLHDRGIAAVDTFLERVWGDAIRVLVRWRRTSTDDRAAPPAGHVR